MNNRDFEFYAVLGISYTQEFQRTVSMLYAPMNVRQSCWSDRLDDARAVLSKMGLAVVDHPDYNRTAVVYLEGTKRKKPACVVLRDTAFVHFDVDFGAELWRIIGNGTVEVLEKGVLNVNRLERSSEEDTDWAEAEDTALLD